MKETSGNDPAVMLFGQRISPPAGCLSPAASVDKDSPTKVVTETTKYDDSLPLSSGVEESTGHETTANCIDNPKTPSIEEDFAKSRSSEAENEQSDAANSQEKTLKKPEKILQCPRCNSMDTKFCYYNNYNVHQPRHFCKACQRYWTAGGTMRNVPVGAGRRKNKNSASHYGQITIAEALQAARVDVLKTNGGVLSFGLEPPNCDSMASMLNLADEEILERARNGFHRLKEKRHTSPCKLGENADECSSSVTGPSSSDEGGPNHPQQPTAQGSSRFSPQITCLPGVLWPYPWNSSVAPPTSSYPAGYPMPFSSVAPQTSSYPAGYPMPFFPPAAYWNCGMPGGWNIPMLSPQSLTSSNQKEQCPTHNSSKLGKHSRDNNELVAPKHKNRCVLVPKTIRIDDPDEAAKSSIWTTLGIRNESVTREGFFNAIQPKRDHEKNRPAEASRLLCANPAALSRSISFREIH